MDIFYRKHRFLNILTISLPLFCFLLSWGGATITTSTSPTPNLPLSSPFDILRHKGYTLFASTIHSALSTSNFNLSGTILAPPDSAFSFSTAKFSPTSLRAPPRPSTSLLLFHTLKPPQLSWLDLTSSSASIAVPTLYNNLCLFITKTHTGKISVSTSSSKKWPISAVKVRQHDLYVDDHLTIHGIDGVLDPTTEDKCPISHHTPPAHIKSQERPYSSFLDHAIRVLKKRGYGIAATALAFKRTELLNLTSLTVFAPSDKSLFFNRSDGFHYDFLGHVIPEQRLRFDRLSSETVVYETLAPNKSVNVEAVNGSVRVDAIPVDATEIYHNRWIVVFSIPTSLDDVVSIDHPLLYSASSSDDGVIQEVSDESPQAASPSVEMEVELIPPPESGEAMGNNGVEGGDLVCPYTTTTATATEGRKLHETDLRKCSPSDNYCQLKDKLRGIFTPPPIQATAAKDDGLLDDFFFYS